MRICTNVTSRDLSSIRRTSLSSQDDGGSVGENAERRPPFSARFFSFEVNSACKYMSSTSNPATGDRRGALISLYGRDY